MAGLGESSLIWGYVGMWNPFQDASTKGPFTGSHDCIPSKGETHRPSQGDWRWTELSMDTQKICKRFMSSKKTLWTDMAKTKNPFKRLRSYSFLGCSKLVVITTHTNQPDPDRHFQTFGNMNFGKTLNPLPLPPLTWRDSQVYNKNHPNFYHFLGCLYLQKYQLHGGEDFLPSIRINTSINGSVHDFPAGSSNSTFQ